MAISALSFLVLCSVVLSVHAFGAGSTGELSNQAGKAFRHGDIEAVIEGLAKQVGHHLSGSSIVQGIAGAVASGSLSSAIKTVTSGGNKIFSERDMKRVYLGNWLRDYSQAMDIGGLSKLTADSILLIIQILGFLTFGYGTREYEITKDKLGVYLLTEHLDNPLGYADGEDPQQYDSRLRPRVDERRELAIDPRNGMKAYIASTGQGFDTSYDCVKRTFQKCIELGRRGRNGDDSARYEAYRLLGTGLHTLEDLSAHSNFVELCLLKMGHREVFCYVGDNVKVQAPNGEQCPPLITGTFGGADFIFSLLGEGSDKLSSSTLTSLQEKMDAAGQTDTDNLLVKVQSILSKFPSSSGSEEKQNQAQKLQEIRKNAINLDPDQVLPEQAQQVFSQALIIRDDIMRGIESLLEQFPIIEQFLGDLRDTLTILVMSAVEPYIKPILEKVLDGISDGSEAILKKEDQMLVFNDPNSSDPSHSLISKDHFDNQLNFVAGKVAVSVVKNAVEEIVEAWSDDNVDPNRTIDTILEALHHPFFASGRSSIQRDMQRAVEDWFQELGQREQRNVLAKLTKEQVKAGNNKVEGSANMGQIGHGCSNHHGKPSARFRGGGMRSIPNRPQGRANFNQPQAPRPEPVFTRPNRQEQHSGRNENQFGRNENQSSGNGLSENSYGRVAQSTGSYANNNTEYGRSNQETFNRPNQEQSYGRNETRYNEPSRQEYGESHRESHRRQDDGENRFGGSHRSEENRFGEDSNRFGRQDTDSSSSRRHEEYGSSRNEGYGESRSHHENRRNDFEFTGYGSSGNNEHSSGRNESRYGGNRAQNEDFGVGNLNLQENSYGRSEHSYGRQEQSHGRQEQSYGNTEYGSNQEGHSRNRRGSNDFNSNRNEYGQEEEHQGRRHQEGGRRHHEEQEERRW